MGQTHLTRTWGTHASTLEDCKFSLQFKASFMWKGSPKNTDLGFNKRGLLNSKTRPNLQNAVYSWSGLLSFPRSHEHLAFLYRNIASLWIELFSACHIPSFQAESGSHACASHVPLIAVLPLSPALSLTSFRRKFQVHFPEFRAGHTEECAALETKFYSCSCVSLAAQFSDINCKNTPTYLPRNLGSSISYWRNKAF